MKIMSVQDCSLGVVTDQAREELPPGAWTASRNMRFKGGAARSMRGLAQVFSAPTVTPYFVQPYQQGSNVWWIEAGLAKVYADNGTSRSDITGTAPTGGIDDRWTGGVLGGVLVLNNGVDVPQYWTGTGTLAALTGWDATWRAAFVRPWRTFLVAGNITKGANNYPHMIKVSDSATPGTIPASWDSTNPALDAVERDAAQSEDFCVDAIPLGDSLLIYKQRSVYSLTETFDARVVDLRRLPGDEGMMSRGCGVNVPRLGHVILTSGDVVLNDGNGTVSIADDLVRRTIFAGIDSTNYKRCFVTSNPAYSEVWICFPESGGTSCTLAAVWNWVTKRWGFRELPSITHAAPGRIVGTVASDLGDSITALGDTMATLGDATTAPPNEARLVLASASYIGVADGGLDDFGTAKTAYIERYGLQPGDGLDSLKDNGKVFTLTEFLPKVDGAAGATLTITLGSAMTPSGSYTFDTPQTFTIGTDHKLFSFATGRYFYLKVAGSGHEWSIRSFEANGVVAGDY